MKQVAIIGAGLQASRRAPVISDDPGAEITAVVDSELARAQALCRRYGGRPSRDWRPVVKDPAIDIVLVLTYPDSHGAIAAAAMKAGKDVLCEKPLTRTLAEARKLVATARETKRILKCGFNHRYHPAILEAYRLFREGVIGRPVFGRSRYGIAGREGLEKEWRSDPEIVGGGQLMEQGVHLMDLWHWFLGQISQVRGVVTTNLWPIAPLEDNGFALLQTRAGVTVSLHASLTQWINLFDFELYGEKGFLEVRGLGASYGVETLTINRYDSQGPFSHETIEFRGGDSSWKTEWQVLTEAIASRQSPPGDGEDGLRAMELVKAVYRASKTGRVINLH